MKKNLLLRLCLVISVVLTLLSCIHDEVYSSSDSSAGYTNKTLWKQDEKYIKNVMDVYSENEKDIRKVSGVPSWDYATTLESFDESFLMVPVVSDNKVVSVLQVPRKGGQVHFYYTNFASQISFFQGLVFAKHKKAIIPESSLTSKSVSCTTQTISVWRPADESNPDSESGEGSWGTRTIVICRELLEDCVGIVNEFGECPGGGGEEPGFPYPGGGGTDPEEEEEEGENPCENAKSIFAKRAVTSRYDLLKGKLNESSETGFGFKIAPDGSIQTSPLNPDATSADKMGVNIYPTTFGYNHTHINKPNGKISIKIFSPRDINTFLEILRNAIANGIPLDTVFGGMVSSDPNHTTNTYQIQYTGDGSDLPPPFTEIQLDNLKSWYTNKAQKIIAETGEQLSHTDLQRLLAETLTKMNIHNTVLFKIEGNVTNPKKISYDQYGNPDEINCP